MLARRLLRPTPWVARRGARGVVVSANTYRDMVAKGRSPEFWLQQAVAGVDWESPPTTALADTGKWFPDGRLSVCHNAVDRHVDAGRGDHAAVHYESFVGWASHTVTYAQLQGRVSRLSGALRNAGVGVGDRVMIFMPMIPEAIVSMLACMRIGAPHVVVFGGFGAPELAARMDAARPTVLLTATCGLEPGRAVPYRGLWDEACARAAHPPATVIEKHREDTPADVDTSTPPRHPNVLDFDTVCADAEPAACVPVPANHPLYILHTSGTTGQPKGIVRDCTHAVPLVKSMADFMEVGVGDTYFCASDVGWVVGHSYIVLGPLLAGAATVLFEGKPVHPDASTYWRIVQRHKPKTMFTAPTALRAIRKLDPELRGLRSHDMSSLKTLFVAGERADPGTIHAFAAALPNSRVVDNYWQTETGWPAAGFRAAEVGIRPGSVGLPVPGFEFACLRADGSPAGADELGALCCKLPLPPGVMTGIHNDDARFQAYFSRFPGFYETGDSGRIDADGYVHVMARLDDVLNVAGHRLSSGHLEEAALKAPDVAEAAVVGVADAVKGEVPVCLAVTRDGCTRSAEDVAAGVVEAVRQHVGPVAALRLVGVVPALPKTRSGKTLRNAIRAAANGERWALPGTVEDASVMDGITQGLRALGLPTAANA